MTPIHSPHHAFWRTTCAWIVIFALLFHGLIPVGYMPSSFQGAGEFLPVRICGGLDTVATAIDKNFHRADEHQNKHSEHQQSLDKSSCLFSLNAFTSLTGLAPPSFIVFLSSLIDRLTFSNFGLLRSRIYGNASSRSPPLSKQ